MLKPILISPLLLAVLSANAANWPQWRGPRHNGVSPETGLAAEWSAGKNLIWRLALPGIGSGTPVVWGENIFVLTATDEGIALLCAGTDGKEKWRRLVSKDQGRGGRGEGNGASPSPATDGKAVYAVSGSGEYVAFDFAGKELWRANLQERHGKFRYDFGFHTTPLLHDGRLYLQLIHPGAARVVALEAGTGKEVWSAERPSDGVAECLHSYASVCLWQDGARAMLVSHGNDYTIGHDLKDGREVWRVSDLNPKTGYNRTLRFVASPVAVADLIVIPTAKNKGVVALRPDATGTIGAGGRGEVWRLESGTPDVPSPVVYGLETYLCRENGVLTCLDTKTGKQHYSERMHNQKYRASPIAADGKIYSTAADGTVTVVKAGPKFQVLAVNKLADSITASPAVANGRLYLRGHQALYAIGAK